MSEFWTECKLFLLNGDRRLFYQSFDDLTGAENMIRCLCLLTVGNPADIRYEVEVWSVGHEDGDKLTETQVYGNGAGLQ